MEQEAVSRSGNRFPSYGRLVAIGLALVAVVSPLYIDRTPQAELELDEQPINLSSYLPLLLLVLITTIALSCCLEHRLIRFDPYWIYRAGGSSYGITIILVVLAFVLKCKASGEYWEV